MLPTAQETYDAPDTHDVPALKRALFNRLMYTIGKDPIECGERDWFFALAYVIRPELFETQSVPVFVETQGRCVGQTVADWHHQWEPRPEVKVCLGVESPGVLALIKERLTR